MHLVFLNVKAHHKIIEEKRRQRREFKVTQRSKKGTQRLLFKSL